MLFREYLDRNMEPRGLDVAALQLLLKALGFDEDNTIAIDGEYGPITATAVEKLQKALGFKGKDVDGNFGPQTRDRVKQVYGIDVNGIPLIREYTFMKAPAASAPSTPDPSI